jgi:hypothetical protein
VSLPRGEPDRRDIRDRRQDLRQFRLLSKDAVRHLIDSALLSRDADPMEFALWMAALVATPSVFFAARQMLTYSALVSAPVELVQSFALSHRLFFVTYGMLAAAFLAAVTWEAIFPDGRDQEVVGVLPVKPYVFAAARLAAAVKVSLIFLTLVNLPAAVLYSFFAMAHPLFGWNLPGLVAGHFAATMLGSQLVFFVLLSIRGLTAVIFGAGAGKWFGAALQVITVVLMFETLFFLPGILATLVNRIMQGDATMMLFPPVWFVALHEWVLGSANQLLEGAMIRGLLAFALASAAVVPMYLVPARWLGRRALEKRSRERAAATTFVVRVVSSLTRTRPAARGLFLFAVASLVRSRRHHLVLASYLGMAVALCIITVFIVDDRGSVKIDRPASWLLTLPMIFVFCGVHGLRSSFRIPTETEANWPFRIAQPSLATCVSATLLVVVTLLILPVAAVTLMIIGPTWPFATTALVLVLQILAGITLTELVLFHWRKVPFACAHAPSPDLLKAWWPIYAFALYVYAFELANWQFAAVSSNIALWSYLVTCGLVITTVRWLRGRQLQKHQLEFDVATQGAERLNLSEALN